MLISPKISDVLFIKDNFYLNGISIYCLVHLFLHIYLGINDCFLKYSIKCFAILIPKGWLGFRFNLFFFIDCIILSRHLE